MQNLFLLDDLEDPSRTSELTESYLNALLAVAERIKTFMARPNRDIGRPGPVCPFVPGALERKTLWLIPEKIADRQMPDMVELIKGYHKLFLDTQPVGGDEAIYKAFVVVLTDLPADRATESFHHLLEDLAVSSYKRDGFSMGGFYEGNESTAIYNPNFRPFISPVPFLLARQTVVSDWKFFLDDKDWLHRWAHRFGESGAQVLAEELRGLPWRSERD
jgi:hypothetical protein